jgi:hypothetical protein
MLCFYELSVKEGVIQTSSIANNESRMGFNDVINLL